MRASERGKPRPAPGRPGGHGTALTALLAAVHAGLFLAAIPPLDLWPLVPLIPIPLVWLALGARSTRGAVVVTVFVQWAMWLVPHAWLLTNQVTGPGWVLLALYLALYGGAFVWLLRLLARGRRPRRVPLAALVPVLWVGLEGLRGQVLFGGYPWFLLAHPLIAVPAAVQSADLFGTYFLSFLFAAPAGAVFDLIAARRGGRGGRRGRGRRGRGRRRPAAAGVALAVIIVHLANLGYGRWRLTQAGVLRPGPRLLVVQTNLPQSNKKAWTIEAQRADVQGFLDLTRRGFSRAEGEGGGPVDLIVWPETMLPVHGLEPETLATLRQWRQDAEVSFAEAVIEMGAELDRPLLLGSPCYLGLEVEPETRRYRWSAHYNSAYLVGGAGPPQRYDKRHLTPFGEEMPYISRWPWLEQKLLSLGASGMSFTLDPGPGLRVLRMRWHEGGLTLGTPICFEDAVPGVCRAMMYEGPRKRGDVLVNLSNDGWFGGFDAGRAQHVQVARFRCIENRVPMVRCANTGLSVSIDSCGRVVGTIGPGRYGAPRQAACLPAPLTLDARRTVYGRGGEWWPWGCLLATAFAAGAAALGSERTRTARP